MRRQRAAYMGPALALAFLGLVACGAEAKPPVLVKTDVFEAGTGGYAHYRIPGLVVTTRGTLLAYCEARRNSTSDWGEIDVFLRRGPDGGATWEPPRKLVSPPEGATKNPVAQRQKLGKAGEITVNNPVAIVDPKTGAVHFLYCVEYARCFSMRSDDDGRTFTEPVEITSTFDRFRPEYDWKVLATGPGHGIALRNGRLLVPVWLSTGTGGHAHRPSAVSVIYSDDQGKSWQRGAIVVAHPDLVNPSETTAVELADGRVMLNIRHEGEPHSRAVSISPDGATGWSKIRFDSQLPEPVCFGSLVRAGGETGQGRGPLLFVNPHNPTGRARRNLTVKRSDDEAATWSIARTIEEGTSGYADIAVGSDQTVFCLYERGTVGGGDFNPKALTLARFPLERRAEGPR